MESTTDSTSNAEPTHRAYYDEARTRSHPCNCQWTEDHPVEETAISLGYAGTSGHQQAATSRDAILDDDTNGVTSKAQRYALILARQNGTRGVTIAELREKHGTLHHGKMSSALTNLHKDGRLVALTERRLKCGIYVLPEFVHHGAETRPYKPNRREIDAQIIVGVLLDHRLRVWDLSADRCSCGEWNQDTADHSWSVHTANKIKEALDA